MVIGLHMFQVKKFNHTLNNIPVNFVKSIKIQDRSWTCICGVTHDRDFNAAVNIRQETINNLIGSAGPESTSMEMDSHGRLIRNNKLLRTVDEVEIKPLKKQYETLHL